MLGVGPLRGIGVPSFGECPGSCPCPTPGSCPQPPTSPKPRESPASLKNERRLSVFRLDPSAWADHCLRMLPLISDRRSFLLVLALRSWQGRSEAECVIPTVRGRPRINVQL